MKNPTFEVITNKVDMFLCVTILMIAVGITSTFLVEAKSMTDSEYIFLQNNIEVEFNAAKKRCISLPSAEYLKCISLAEANKNAARLELEEKRKVVTENEKSMKSKVDFNLGIESNNTNAMPVMSGPTPAFRQKRLI